MTEKQKQELFAMLFYAKQDYRRRVQNFGSTDEIVEIASARVTTLRAVIDLLEIGRQLAKESKNSIGGMYCAGLYVLQNGRRNRTTIYKWFA